MRHNRRRQWRSLGTVLRRNVLRLLLLLLPPFLHLSFTLSLALSLLPLSRFAPACTLRGSTVDTWCRIYVIGMSPRRMDANQTGKRYRKVSVTRIIDARQISRHVDVIPVNIGASRRLKFYEINPANCVRYRPRFILDYRYRNHFAHNIA